MGESRRTYQFGPLCLQVDRRLLVRDGEPVALAPKVLETLVALIEHRDRVLTKDELLQRIWGETIVEEGGLTRNISVLRKALGETPTITSTSSPYRGAGTGSSRKRRQT